MKPAAPAPRATPHGDEPVDSNLCTAEKPDAVQHKALYDGCTASWDQGGWGWNGVEGAYSQQCSDAAEQTQAVRCMATVPGGAKVEGWNERHHHRLTPSRVARAGRASPAVR